MHYKFCYPAHIYYMLREKMCYKCKKKYLNCEITGINSLLIRDFEKIDGYNILMHLALQICICIVSFYCIEVLV